MRNVKDVFQFQPGHFRKPQSWPKFINLNKFLMEVSGKIEFHIQTTPENFIKIGARKTADPLASNNPAQKCANVRSQPLSGKPASSSCQSAPSAKGIPEKPANSRRQPSPAKGISGKPANASCQPPPLAKGIPEKPANSRCQPPPAKGISGKPANASCQPPPSAKEISGKLANASCQPPPSAKEVCGKLANASCQLPSPAKGISERPIAVPTISARTSVRSNCDTGTLSRNENMPTGATVPDRSRANTQPVAAKNGRTSNKKKRSDSSSSVERGISKDRSGSMQRKQTSGKTTINANPDDGPPDDSQVIQEINNLFLKGREALKSGFFPHAATFYVTAQAKIKDHSLERKQEYVLCKLPLAYAISEAKVFCEEYKDIKEGIVTLRSLVEEGVARKFPAIIYLLGLAYYKLNRYEEAKEELNKADLLIRECVKFDSYPWPGTFDVINTTQKSYLKAVVSDLLRQCKAYRKPDWICLFTECENISTHIIPSRKIYFNDPDFNGYVALTCSEKCSMIFHPSCWKSYKEQQSIRRLTDKAILGKPCLTPDCKAAGIIGITLFNKYRVIIHRDFIELENARKVSPSRCKNEDETLNLVAAPKCPPQRKPKTVRVSDTHTNVKQPPANTRKIEEKGAPADYEEEEINFEEEVLHRIDILDKIRHSWEQSFTFSITTYDFSPLTPPEQFVESFFVEVLRQTGPMELIYLEMKWKQHQDILRQSLPHLRSLQDLHVFLLYRCDEFVLMGTILGLRDDVDKIYNTTKEIMIRRLHTQIPFNLDKVLNKTVDREEPKTNGAESSEKNALCIETASDVSSGGAPDTQSPDLNKTSSSQRQTELIDNQSGSRSKEAQPTTSFSQFGDIADRVDFVYTDKDKDKYSNQKDVQSMSSANQVSNVTDRGAAENVLIFTSSEDCSYQKSQELNTANLVGVAEEVAIPIFKDKDLKALKIDKCSLQPPCDRVNLVELVTGESPVNDQVAATNLPLDSDTVEKSATSQFGRKVEACAYDGDDKGVADDDFVDRSDKKIKILPLPDVTNQENEAAVEKESCSEMSGKAFVEAETNTALCDNREINKESDATTRHEPHSQDQALYSNHLETKTGTTRNPATSGEKNEKEDDINTCSFALDCDAVQVLPKRTNLSAAVLRNCQTPEAESEASYHSCDDDLLITDSNIDHLESESVSEIMPTRCVEGLSNGYIFEENINHSSRNQYLPSLFGSPSSSISIVDRDNFQSEAAFVEKSLEEKPQDEASSESIWRTGLTSHSGTYSQENEGNLNAEAHVKVVHSEENSHSPSLFHETEATQIQKLVIEELDSLEKNTRFAGEECLIEKTFGKLDSCYLSVPDTNDLVKRVIPEVGEASLTAAEGLSSEAETDNIPIHDSTSVVTLPLIKPNGYFVASDDLQLGFDSSAKLEEDQIEDIFVRKNERVIRDDIPSSEDIFDDTGTGAGCTKLDLERRESEPTLHCEDALLCISEDSSVAPVGKKSVLIEEPWEDLFDINEESRAWELNAVDDAPIVDIDWEVQGLPDTQDLFDVDVKIAANGTRVNDFRESVEGRHDIDLVSRAPADYEMLDREVSWCFDSFETASDKSDVGSSSATLPLRPDAIVFPDTSDNGGASSNKWKPGRDLLDFVRLSFPRENFARLVKALVDLYEAKGSQVYHMSEKAVVQELREILQLSRCRHCCEEEVLQETAEFDEAFGGEKENTEDVVQNLWKPSVTLVRIVRLSFPTQEFYKLMFALYVTKLNKECKNIDDLCEGVARVLEEIDEGRCADYNDELSRRSVNRREPDHFPQGVASFDRFAGQS